MEKLYHIFNPWWENKYKFPGISRDNYLTELLNLKDRKDIVLITGLRRVGKTTIMRQLIFHLIKEINPKRIFYISLDNIALKDKSISEIVDTFRTINSLKQSDFVYLLLDEVHFKDEFELQLKNIYDIGNAKIFASGSSSLEIIMKTPYLTGRQRVIQISPLNFSEYLKFLNITVSSADTHLYPKLAEEYIITGGMPEYVLTKDLNTLQSLVNSILYRDIAGRYEIRKKENLLDILSLTAQSVGSPISLRKISKILAIPVETINNILQLLLEAGLIYMVEKHGKVSERKLAPRKIYLADTGLFTILTENINLGAIVENLVFLILLKKWQVRYYRHSGYEIDFITKDIAWEVKYKKVIKESDLNNIKKIKGPKSRIMITFDTEQEIENIKCLPLWKFLQEYSSNY
jgi:predicted AAA+ superfamily ATPase